MIGLSSAFLSLATACATSTGEDVPMGALPPLLSFYAPSEIIVGTRNIGTFKIVGRCLLFELVRPVSYRSPALFPPGSAWVDGASAIRLPNGQSIPIGQTVEAAYEAPPSPRYTVPGCPGETIHILNVVDKKLEISRSIRTRPNNSVRKPPSTPGTSAPAFRS